MTFVFDENKDMMKSGKRSPLYTSKSDKAKKEVILQEKGRDSQEKGRDSDGAYRAYGRIDTKRTT